jgi:putative membrane protein
MRRRKTFLILLIAALLLIPACKRDEAETTTDTPVVTATAVDTTPTGGTVVTATVALEEADRQFVIDATTMLLGEIEFAKTADAQAKDTSVKAFAHLVRLDLERMLAELRDMAGRRTVDLPAATVAASAEANAKLAAMSGKEFDVEFLRLVGADHLALITLLEAEALVVKDEELREWVGKNLPILRGHMDKAKELQTKIAGMTY